MNIDWFYQAGSNVGGPLPLDSIQAAVKSGRLASDVMISNFQTGPWISLAPVKERVPARASRPRKSVAGFIEVIGYVMVACGILSILATPFLIASATYPAGFSPLSSIVSGLLFLAVAEALRKLGRISDSAERRMD